jgi:tetratricopeptide (TPR) repeat protein
MMPTPRNRYTQPPGRPREGLDEAASFADYRAEGLRHHAAGRFAAAARSYQQALQAKPDDPDTLLLFGILARQTRQHTGAVTLIRAAIAVLPAGWATAHFHLNLAHAYHASGDLAEAETACRRALVLNPEMTAAHCRLADILADQGRLEEAEQCCRAVLAVKPEFAHVYYSLGSVLCRKGNYISAAVSYKSAIKLEPRRAEFYFGFGYALNRLDDVRAAREAFVAAIRLQPDFAEAHLNLGNLYYDHGHAAAAALHYGKALHLRPRYLKAIINLGNALTKHGRASEAIACYRRALELQPNSVAAQHGLGNALADSKDWDAARECFEKALALEPGSADVLNSLGNLHYSRKSMRDAAGAYRQALEIDASYARAYVNLGNAVLAQGRHNEARTYYEQGLALDASLPGARYNLALTQLRNGEFTKGWQNYEARWDFEELRLRRRHANTSLWKGEPLEGKTILLHAEQGLGDTLQFVRFVPLVVRRGGRVILEVQSPLARLLRGFPEVAQVVVRGAMLPAFDYQCPLMSLPLALGTSLESIPSAEGYLKFALDTRQTKPDKASQLRVGLAWSGNPRNKGDANRSMPLVALLPLADVPGLKLISLQKDTGVEQLASLRDQLPIEDAASSHTDMQETAKLVASLDLVLSVDTSIAHLAGAMGKPVWIMLPWVADWRWMEQRSTSLWYASARLFRQTAVGDWDSVARQIVAALQDQKR